MIMNPLRSAAALAAFFSLVNPSQAQEVRTTPYTPHVGDSTTLTSTEERVREIIATDGIHVVHFWSPRSENSISEFRKGWFELIENNGDVAFTFVTVWNDGEIGLPVLEKFVILDRIETLALPDNGPSSIEANRRRSFLGLPLIWTPSTWIFHQNGQLAFAMNYGEMGMNEVQSLIDITRQEWRP